MISLLQEKLREERKAKKSGGFESMGLHRDVFRDVRHKGYRILAPIQRKTMPLILSRSDIVAMARTGSGKTVAFLVPMLQRLRCHVPQFDVLLLPPCQQVHALDLSDLPRLPPPTVSLPPFRPIHHPDRFPTLGRYRSGLDLSDLPRLPPPGSAPFSSTPDPTSQAWLHPLPIPLVTPPFGGTWAYAIDPAMGYGIV